MKNRYFKNKPRMIIILLVIAFASLAVRLLVEYRFHESALLYVGIPFAISFILILVRSPSESISWKKRYLNRLIDAFIIMLASSVVLFEGFVCVVMFMPIYLIIVLVMFVVDILVQRARQKSRSSVHMHIFSIFIVASSFEGVAPQFSFDRDEQISVNRVVQVSIADIKENLQRPINLQKQRPWFLYLFPMPYEINAGSLKPGDVHEIHFRYYRWFVTNVHEGYMLLEISEVADNRIKTTFLKDSSYFSNYLHLKGTEIILEKVDEHHTRVTLSIDFKRTLDPYWYFSPIERYGVSKTAEFLITEVIARETN